jgi:hypothetical protein
MTEAGAGGGQRGIGERWLELDGGDQGEVDGDQGEVKRWPVGGAGWRRRAEGWRRVEWRLTRGSGAMRGEWGYLVACGRLRLYGPHV